MININVKKSKSNETLAYFANKIKSNSFVKTSKSELSISRPRNQIHYKEIIKGFFENYPKNIFNESINWLKVFLSVK